MNFLFIHKWHKRIGIVTALFVLFLALTGLLLNHTSDMNLSGEYVSSNWLLNWYDIEADQEVKSFAVEGHFVSQLGERLYFNTTEIGNDIVFLVGAVVSGQYYVIAHDQSLILLNTKGEVVEILSGVDGVPAGMKKIGLGDSGELVLDAAHGYYKVKIDSLHWHEEDEANAVWSEAVSLSDSLYEQIAEQYRGRGLPLERVIQDVHSGRILGLWGVYFMDAVSILFCILALSGIYMWYRRH